MTEYGCTDWRIFCQEYKDRDTAYVLCAVMVHDSVFAEGKASASKNARVNAARQALDKLAKMSAEDYKKLCNCETLLQQEAKIREEEKERKLLAKAKMMEAAGSV